MVGSAGPVGLPGPACGDTRRRCLGSTLVRPGREPVLPTPLPPPRAASPASPPVRIAVDTIPEHGREVTVGTDASWSREAAREALDVVPERLEGALELRREGDHVHVTGELRSVHTASCDRCLSPIRVSLGGELALEYAPAGTQVLEEDRELEAKELDLGWHEGGAIELSQVLSEQLALWLPARLLCGAEGIERLTEGDCALPAQEQDEGPAPGRQRPFANLRLPE